MNGGCFTAPASLLATASLGFVPAAPPRRDAAERADVLAYLDARVAAAETMAARSAEFTGVARERRRQLLVIRDEVAAGFHAGAARVARFLEGEM